MKQAFIRIFRSRVLGFVAIAALAFGVVSLGRIWWEAWPWFGPRLEALPHPKIDEIEKVMQEKILVARKESEAIMADSGTSRRQRATAYGQLGKLYLTTSFHAAAAVCFRNAAALDREEFRWPYLQARALMREGNTQASAAAMAEALKRMPRDVTTTPRDLLAALNFLGEAAVRLNKPDDARAMFERALEANPKAAFPLFKLGQLASRAGDGSRAISYFERALALLPQNSELRRQLANEYRRSGENAKADQIAVSDDSNRETQITYSDPLYASVQELNQSSAHFNQRASRRAREGLWREALGLYERSWRLNPDTAAICGGYVGALIQMEHAEQAQKIAEQCASKPGAASGSRGVLINAYAAAPATRPKALEIALEEVKATPDKPEVLFRLAVVYRLMGRHADSLRILDQVGKLDKPSPRVPLEQANELAALRRFADARAKLEKALADFAGDVDVSLVLARFLATCPDPRNRNGARAVELMQGLIKIQYSVVRGETLAVALAETGRFEPALEAQRKALAVFGDRGAPKLGERLKKVMKSLEARKAWREPWPFMGADRDQGSSEEEPAGQ